MADVGQEPAPEIFTIGHSNVEAERIIELLRRYAVRVVVDVRSAPYSRYSPQFNKDNLRRILQAAGIAYVYGGAKLGGRPQDPECYAEGQVRYALIESQPWYRDGIDHLLETAREQRCAIMCAEEDPAHCHRHHLISQTLLQKGARVWHIRGDGRVEAACLKEAESEQLSLL
jgi:uncharacterized protein (DUF488 family)